MVAVKILTAVVAFDLEVISSQSKTPKDKRKSILREQAILDRGYVALHVKLFDMIEAQVTILQNSSNFYTQEVHRNCETSPEDPTAGLVTRKGCHVVSQPTGSGKSVL